MCTFIFFISLPLLLLLLLFLYFNYFVLASAFEQGHLEPRCYINTFIIIIIDFAVVIQDVSYCFPRILLFRFTAGPSAAHVPFRSTKISPELMSMTPNIRDRLRMVSLCQG